MEDLELKIKDAIWVAHTLFDLSRATGSSSNLSFKHNNLIYITATNTSFGRLTKDDFAVMDLVGNSISDVVPSKEWPLHLELYQNNQNANAVIHTHSTYATLWSCLSNLNETDAVPDFTPYLEMKVGKVKLIPYAKPGSNTLFELFHLKQNNFTAYLLAHHGPILYSKSILNAFYDIEELEESCKIAYLIHCNNLSCKRIKHL